MHLENFGVVLFHLIRVEIDPARELTLLAHKENRPNSIIVPQCGRTIVMDTDKMDFEHDDKAVQEGAVTVYQ